MVRGREDGEPAITKDEKGLPVKDQPEVLFADGTTREDRSLKSVGDRLLKSIMEQKTRERVVMEKIDEDKGHVAGKKLRESARKREWAQKQHLKRQGDEAMDVDEDGEKIWKVPDTDDEEDEVEGPILFDPKGKWIPHEYWPSVWRKKAAEHVNEIRVSKTVSNAPTAPSRADKEGLRVAELTASRKR